MTHTLSAERAQHASVLTDVEERCRSAENALRQTASQQIRRQTAAESRCGT